MELEIILRNLKGIKPENKAIRSSKQMEPIMGEIMCMCSLSLPPPQVPKTHHQEEVITLQIFKVQFLLTLIIFKILKY